MVISRPVRHAVRQFKYGKQVQDWSHRMLFLEAKCDWSLVASTIYTVKICTCNPQHAYGSRCSSCHQGQTSPTWITLSTAFIGYLMTNWAEKCIIAIMSQMEFDLQTNILFSWFNGTHHNTCAAGWNWWAACSKQTYSFWRELRTSTIMQANSSLVFEIQHPRPHVPCQQSPRNGEMSWCTRLSANAVRISRKQTFSSLLKEQIPISPSSVKNLINQTLLTNKWRWWGCLARWAAFP